MSTAQSNMPMQFTADKVKALRMRYEAELAEKKKKFQSRISDLEGKLRAAKNADYAEPYIQTFKISLDTLETLFREMQKVHDETRGIDFRVGSYINTCKPGVVPRGGVYAYFTDLAKRCREAVNAVAASKSIEDDVEHLKTFCQCLTDLRYIHKNAARLIADSGLPAKDRKETLDPLQLAYNRAAAEYREATRVEKLACYNNILSLRRRILAGYDKVQEDILGKGSPGFDNTYQFLVGFYKTEVAQEDIDFATSVLQVPAEAVDREPIYFNYTVQHDSLLIKAPSVFLESNQFNDFIRNLYFSFVSRLPARNLLFCGVECNTIDAVVGGLGEKIHQLGPAYILHEVVDRGNDLTATGGVLSRLRSFAGENSKKQKGESITDIFAYNQQFPDNPQKFVLFCVNNYPEGFNAGSAAATQDLLRMVNGGSKGIISVICGTTDGRYTDNAPMLTAEQLHADCVEFTEDGEMFYNGLPATMDITTADFSPRDYWFMLDKYFKSSASISLEALLKASERVYNKPDPIAIPVGNSDGAVYHLELTECTDRLFGLVIGTVGSGKSAFLHTLILSAAYTHSPEDLQFYLADFKDGSGSTEFSHYRKEEGVENLYIPHVRYLLLKGKTESAFDLLEKIESIRSERAKILTAAGYSQITDYNKSPAVVSGKAKKIPTVIFVIDEYNAMLGGGNGQNSDNPEISMAIAAKIKNLISTARAYGIGILLCGQSVDKALKNGQALGNMGCRISLPVKSDSELVSLFDMDSYEARKQMQKLAGQGDALISVGSTANVRYVRTAYSGKTNGAQQLRLAQAIRQKYAKVETTQVEAGSETAVPVTEVADYPGVYTGREDELVLRMGVSSANAMGVPLVYSLNEAAFNYYACATREKLCKIERNVMFAFLEAMAGKPRPDGTPLVTYLGLQEKQEECLGAYLSAVPELADHIELVENKANMARKLMTLRTVYRERKRAYDRGRTTWFDPMLVVVRDIAWLNDKDADWLPKADAAERNADLPKTTLQSINQADLAAVSAKMGGMSDSLRSILAGDVDVAAAPTGGSRRESRQFTVADVRQTLATLYANGNLYGIFVLVSSEMYKPVADILVSEADDKTLALSKYGIFGSFEESRKHVTDLSAPEDCVFINYFNSKTRLYSYETEECQAWWDGLKKKLAGSK